MVDCRMTKRGVPMATDDGFVILIGISKGSHAVDPAGFFPKSRRGIAPVTNAAIAAVLLNAGDPAVDKYVVFCFKIVQHGRNDFLIEHGIPGCFSDKLSPRVPTDVVPRVDARRM